MNIKITGKDLKATEAIKDYIEKKMTRLEKYFEGEELDVQSVIKLERELQIAEISAQVKGNTFRAVAENKDLYASIDEDIDILERQVRKAKTRRERMNKDDSLRVQEEAYKNEPTVIEDEVIKTTYYSIKPMSMEDAKLKLQERPTATFLAYIDVDTNKVNVIYKLKDGKNYGLVEPEA